MKNDDRRYKVVTCKECLEEPVRVDLKVKAAICWRCTQKGIEPESVRNENKPSRPGGWHFMAEFVSKDGTVYHKGVEQPDLNGTLEPTKIKKKKKKVISTFQKAQNEFKEVQKLAEKYNNKKNGKK